MGVQVRCRRPALGGLIASAALGMATPGLAQETPATAGAAGADGGDILVTARRREERLQDVPVSVTALDGAGLRSQGISSFRDVASQVPGFSYETLQPLVPQASIRGQTNLRTDSPVQNVSFFLDGVYLQRAYLVDQKLIELERIEVIKGPQSALYGRNAFAGAVNMVSRTPDLAEWKGRVSGTVGTDERYEIRGWVSAPLVPEKLAVLVAGAWSQFDGTWRNNHPLADAEGANTRGKIGGYDNWMFQGRVIAKPTDTLTLDALWVRTERDEETVPSYTVSSGTILSNFRNSLNASPRPNLTPPFAIQNRLWVGAFPVEPVISPQDPNRPRGIVIDPRAFGVRGPTDIVTGKLTWAPDDLVEASYQLSFLRAAVRGRGSPSPNPLDPINFPPLLVNATIFDESGTDSSYRGWNHEVKFSFRGNGRWNGFLGFSYSRTTDIASNASSNAPTNTLIEPDPAVYLFPVGPGLPFPSNLLQRNTFLERKEDIFSGYGFLEILFDPRFILTLEGRYTIEDQSATDFLTREPTNPTLQAFAPPRFRQSLDYFTPRITATFRPTDDNLVYASVARGVKAGNLNGNTPFVPQRSYASETNWTYEIGTKNQFGPVRLNAAAFHTDWSDLQTSVVRLQANGTAPSFFAIVPSTVGNIGGVTVWGFEADALWQVVPEFQLFGGVSYNKSRYKDGSVSQRFGASGNCDGIVCAPITSVPTAVLPVGGNQLERVPDWNAVGGFSFDTRFSNGWGFNARADITYKDRQYMDEANLAFVRARTLVNGSLGVTAGPVDVTLWARNLFDKRYVSTALFLIGTSGALSASYVPTFGERRTVGLTAGVNF
jgi:iron complex outermembrane receptor protein